MRSLSKLLTICVELNFSTVEKKFNNEEKIEIWFMENTIYREFINNFDK